MFTNADRCFSLPPDRYELLSRQTTTRQCPGSFDQNSARLPRGRQARAHNAGYRTQETNARHRYWNSEYPPNLPPENRSQSKPWTDAWLQENDQEEKASLPSPGMFFIPTGARPRPDNAVMEKYESGYAETIPDDDDDKGSRISNDGSLYEQRTGASGRTESRSKPPSPSSVSSHLPRHASMRNHPTPSDDASVAARWKELLDRETRVAALESELSSQQTRLHYERQALARESHRLMLKELRLRSVEQPLRFRQYSPERPYASMWTPVARHAGPWSERICRMPGLDEMEKEDEEWGNSHGVDGFDGDNDEEDSPGTWPAFL